MAAFLCLLQGLRLAGADQPRILPRKVSSTGMSRWKLVCHVSSQYLIAFQKYKLPGMVQNPHFSTCCANTSTSKCPR